MLLQRLLLPLTLALSLSGCRTVPLPLATIDPDRPLSYGTTVRTDGQCYSVRITGEQLDASPDWDTSHSAVPSLSLFRARRVASRALFSFVRSTSDWRLESVQLKNVYASKWVYTFNWEHLSSRAERAVVFVLLSGETSVAEPTTEDLCITPLDSLDQPGA